MQHRVLKLLKASSLVLSLLLLSLPSCKQVTLKGQSDHKTRQQFPFIEKRLTTLEQQIAAQNNRISLLERNTPDITENEAISSDVIFIMDDNVLDDPLIGSGEGDRLLMVFTDLLCDTCKAFFKTTFPPLLDAVRKMEHVQVRLRDFPLSSSPLSEKAAHAANCAGENGQYWQYLERLQQTQLIDEHHLIELAGETPDISPEDFLQCFSSDKYSREIAADKQAAQNLGINGVPSMFIGKKVSNVSFKGYVIKGNQPIEAYLHLLNKLSQ